MSHKFLSIALLTLLAAPAATTAQDFSSGDLYVVSSSLGPNGNFTAGISNVNPFTGATTFVKPVQYVLSNPTFDAFRQKLIFKSQLTTAASSTGLYAFDAAGTATPLYSGAALTNVSTIAAGKNGIIYMTNNLNQLRYIDAANGLHDVLDLGGSGSFAFATPTLTNIRAIYYDAGTNSMLVAWIGPNVCGSSLAIAPYVTKVSLTATGTQVASAESTVATCVSVGVDAGDSFIPNTFSPGPNGRVFLSFDNNAYVQCGRMITIDPATLAYSTFATTTTYFGCPAANAGCYSTALGRGFILDTFNNALRAFGQGEIGEGTILASGDYISSVLGSGESTYVLEIPFGIFGGLSNYGAGTAGCMGQMIMGANSAPVVNAPNFYLTTTNCPPNSLGLILASDAADPIGNDAFQMGIITLLDLVNSTQLVNLDAVSNGFGFAASTIAIPISPILSGQTFFAQSYWVWPVQTCNTTGQLNLSTSNGLAIAIQ
ncbi:MAG: hypothetical protein HY286_16915 [Planctomycetes bacterium]|nr:hypothetical protein [Planctomycetota bacterium]